jgi:hypothetical protein
MTESTGTESTGIASVDEVVAGLVVLDELPVAEHVAVFERVHESLRAQMTTQMTAQATAPVSQSVAAVGETPRA